MRQFEHENFWSGVKFKKHGEHTFTAEELFERAKAYFAWIDAHPLQELQAFHNKGSIVSAQIPKMRAYTIEGLATFIGISSRVMERYRNGELGEDHKEVMEFIDQIMYSQKFEGAAANMMNAGFISRALGLADKREMTGANGGPIETKDVSARELLAERLAALTQSDAADEAAVDNDGSAV